METDFGITKQSKQDKCLPEVSIGRRSEKFWEILSKVSFMSEKLAVRLVTFSLISLIPFSIFTNDVFIDPEKI